MKQISANVYVEDQWSVPPRCRGSNWGFVTTSAGIVMVDSPMVPRTAVEWRDKLAAMGEVRYLIDTHHHVDHITGNFFFPGEVVSSEGVRELFTAPFEKVGNRERMAEVMKIGKGTIGYIRLLVEGHDPESLPLLDDYCYQLKPPTVTFTDRMSLYVGDHTFEMMLLPGHTQSHIGVYIPQEKVFFAGDNFCSGTQPSLTQCLPREWVRSLKKIEAMDIDVVVPGHGEMCGLDEVRQFRLFIQQCIKMVSEAIKKGLSKEQAAASLSFEHLYPRDQSNMAVHPGAGHQHLNVMRLYDMLSG